MNKLISEDYMQRIKSFLDGLKIEQPGFVRNLVLFPIEGGNGDGKKGYLTLDTALEQEKAKVSETEGGRVETVMLENLSNSPIFLMDGEEVIGARQNRIVNTSILAQESSRLRIPVSCVEEGRWSGDSTFSSDVTCAYPRLRSKLCLSLHKSNGFKSNQNVVWKEVKRKLTSLETRSNTQSMHDAYLDFDGEIKRYIEEFSLNGKTCGVAAVLGRRLLSLDLFSNRELFHNLSRKLIKSYALDGLESENTQTPSLTEDWLGKRFNEIGSIKKMKWIKSIGLGEEVRMKSARFVGKALLHNGDVIHLSVFPLSS